MRLTRDDVLRAGRGQGGVVTRRQLLDLGADPAWLSRQVAAGAWQRLAPGVLAPWSGPVPWRARAWGALLAAGPGAALSHHAAAALHGFTTAEPRQIDVTVPHHRRVAAPPGARLHRRRRMPPVGGRPARVWAADTVVELVAASTTADEAVGWVTAAARAGVHDLALTEAIARRGAFRRRALLLELVAEVVEGVESTLEHRYHRDVGRRHGLPQASLQVRQVAGGMLIRADAVYDGLAVRVELDGRLGHPGGRTDEDTWRDNAVLLTVGDLTLRYRWSHVALRPCEVAAQVAAALRAQGWPGTARPCGPTCTLASA